jgi:hypothetical protein
MCSWATRPPSTSPKAPPSTPPTRLTGTESHEQLYVALSRGRTANHLHLSPGPVDDQDPAHPVLNVGRRVSDTSADPLELLRTVLGRTDHQPSATSTLTAAGDPGQQLHTAVERYLDAHTLAEARVPRLEQANTGGPLPWLPPPPQDDSELAEYVQQRADLVHALSATITADHLPGTTWADQLRETNPDLARQLAVWRAATGNADHPDPLGSHDSPAPELRADLRTLHPIHLLDHKDLDWELEIAPSHIRHEPALRATARHDGRARRISR